MIFRLTLFFSTIVTLAIVHAASLEFYLYWRYLWLDVPVHFLGGVAVALGVSILPFFRVSLPPFLSTLSGYLLLTFFAGTVWEMFEFVSEITVVDEHFIPDTTLDLVMDLLGGAVGYWLVRRTDLS